MVPRDTRRASATLIFVVSLVAVVFDSVDATAPVDFAEQIQPIFKSHCYGCHGPELQESSFRLDIRDRAMAGGDLGEPPIVPGKSDASRLIQYVSSADDGVAMPPDGKGQRLSDEEISLLRRWIDAGAEWPDAFAGDEANTLTTDHWSFQPITNAEPRQLNCDWVYNPIDAFIWDALQTDGLHPSGTADRITLTRRIYLDMHGLPPTSDQVRAFVDNTSPEAYAQLVESVLASFHYGERWARHWLDVVRFAESTGYEVNRDRENAYHYRDYVIAALNSDQSYRDFVVEQLAGDVVGVDVGTGFLVGGPYDLVKSPDQSLTRMQRQDELADYVNTTGTAFLGLTIGCARCHNHKFDPILQKDYYSMQAVFAGVQHGERELRNNTSATTQQQIEATAAELELAEAELARLRVTAASIKVAKDTRATTAYQNIQKLRDRIGSLRDAIPKAYIGTFQQPELIHRLFRGDPSAERELVEPDALSVIGTLGLDNNTPESGRRLALAKWIARSENPLAARVIVNRVWHYHFGTGLVSTPSDFGKNGTPPSHPKLLDWLAWNFMENDWSIKWLHRQILLSHTYQQSSTPRDEALAIDADSRMLWRFPPRRLEAEAIRDCVLFASGALNETAGGPGFSLFDIDHENVHHYFPKREFGADECRRMIYMTKIRQEQDEVFGVFDCPDGGQVIPDRSRSTTPLQALNLLNSKFMLQQAEFLAERIRKEAGEDLEQQIRHVFEVAFSREPDAHELRISLELTRKYGLSALCRAIFNANEFLFLS